MAEALAAPHIDAVITWVDGSDPAHLAKRDAVRAGAHPAPSATAPTRFAHSGELRFCIASLLKNAPWIRRIHILTDARTPPDIAHFINAGLCDSDRLRVVDHTTLFAGHEDALPTFNSRSIETMLWRCPDLAPVALYLNDDFFLTAPLKPAHIVDDAGRLRLEGHLRPTRWPLAKAALRSLTARATRRAPRPGHIAAQARAAAIAGTGHFLQTAHRPAPFHPATLRDWCAANPDALAHQIGHRFRDAAQFLPLNLANQLDLTAGRAVTATPRPVAYLRPGRSEADPTVLDTIANGRAPYACIQSLDSMAPQSRAAIIACLTDTFRETLPG